jgi:hypothetical protein
MQKDEVIADWASIMERIGELFDDAISGKWKGKPVSVGITSEGKAFLESLSGSKMKDSVDFVLNPSDLIHIFKEHWGDNEKNKDANSPLGREDILNIIDVIKQPESIIYLGNDGNSGAKYAFLKQSDEGSYNLIEVYGDRKGNLTAKTYYKTKRGVSQRAIVLEKESLHSTSETTGATSSCAKIPILIDSPKNQKE